MGFIKMNMLGIKWKAALLVFVAVIGFMWLPQRVVYAENEAINAVETQIEVIDEAVEGVLEVLYGLEQEIQAGEARIELIEGQITGYERELLAYDVLIDQETEMLNKQIGVLADVLRVYQRRGPGTFFEILLSSQSLSDFVNRLNLLRDLSKNTEGILEAIEGRRLVVEGLKDAVVKQKELIKLEEMALVEAMKTLLKTQADQEALLSSLNEEQAAYVETLEGMKLSWKALKPIFARTSTAFSQLAQSGSLPADAMTLSFGSAGLEAIITEKDFNRAIINQANLPDMKFTFLKDQIRIVLSEYELSLWGRFRVENDRVLVFEAYGGTFYEVALSESSLELLFKEGALSLNLRPLTGTNKIASVRTELSELILSIQLSLF